MKASDLLVRCLEKEGIRYIFGVPGEENADLMMSLEASSIRFVLTRHEQGAAFMAEVFGRLDGNPAVCLGTLGPGATNLLTGVADGNMDRAPMLVITAQASTDRQHKESHQVIDIVDLYESVTKWSHGIRHADSIPEIVRKAVRVARSEKPGAVLLELPENIARAETTAVPIEPRRFRRPGPDDKTVDRAWEVIRNAQRPIIIAGNGAIRKRSSRQLRKFCEATGIGVLMTFMGKGAVDRNAEYCLFGIGLQEKDWPSYAVENADVIITLGYDLIEYPPRLWNPDGNECVVHIDFYPAEIDEHYQPRVECIGDIAHTLWMLNERVLRDGPGAHDFSFQRKVRDEMLRDFAAHAADRTDGTIRPQKALWDIREALGPRDLLISGVGAHKMWVGRYYHSNEPNTCIIPNGFCSMGLALPGAISACLVDGGRRVFVVAGDGDFLMNVQEMETATRLGVDMTVMVWEDGEYGLISWKQETEFGRHTPLSFGNPDWIKLADSFGWQGQYVANSNELSGAIQRALDHPGPSLIVIPIDYRENLLLSERLGGIQATL